MMMQTATLMSATTLVATMLSPSKTGRVRVSQMVAGALSAAPAWRHDPYNWRALSSPVRASLISPERRQPLVAAESPVPQANRLMYAAVAAAPTAPVAVRPAAASAPVVSAPKAPAAPRYAFVQFTHESYTYLAPFKISVGDVVIVEGDRGEEIGRVTEITTVVPTYPVPAKVIRRATAKDQASLNAKVAKEAEAKRLCQQLSETLGLNITILDALFQFDYNKLTVYFAAKTHHIDFRKLQRTLFREYRCRIWLSNMAEIEAQNNAPRCR